MNNKELRSELEIDPSLKCWVQKVLGSPINIYVISFNSYSNNFLSDNRLKNSKIASIKILRKNIVLPKKLTPAIDLDSFKGKIPNNSFIFIRDLSGETLVGL